MGRVTIDNWTDETMWDAVHTVNGGAYRVEENDNGGYDVYFTETGEKIVDDYTSWHIALGAISLHINKLAAMREP